MGGYAAIRRSKRTFHRTISGLQQRGRSYRFITLGMGPQGTTVELQAAWHRLVARLKRRKLLQEYIKVGERGDLNGSLHLHIIYAGKYIDAYLLRDMWIRASGKRYVYIQRVKKRSPAGAANELAKYMTKDPQARLGYSQHWAFPQLAAYWSAWKREGRQAGVPWNWVLFAWKTYCVAGRAPPILLPTRPKRVGWGSLIGDLRARSQLSAQPRLQPQLSPA